MKSVVQEYRADGLIVRFDPRICTHSGHCVRGLRTVFDVNKRPWVAIDGASTGAIAAQIEKCPSGALTYELVSPE